MVWIQGITCNGNSHSFLNYQNLDLFLENIEFLYHPILPSKFTLKELVNKKFDFDILIIEGAINKKYKRANGTFFDLFKKLAFKAKYIIALGNCASFGGVFRSFEKKEIKGLVFDGEVENGFFKELKRKIINIPGCPAHPEWLVYVIFMLIDKKRILLDKYLRPKEIYSYTVHMGCNKNEYFEWKVDAKSFGVKEGCLFYMHGCQGPFTHGSCNKILWNEVSSKTRVGAPCFGCTEPTFMKKNLFETKTYMSIPANMPLGVPKRAYLTLTGVAKSFKIDRLTKRLIDEN
ncbi:MAG TPA: hydrogenase [Campylobacterales bacterium]|nr:hydrogenase [Campylobacterales bacterium]